MSRKVLAIIEIFSKVSKKKGGERREPQHFYRFYVKKSTQRDSKNGTYLENRSVGPMTVKKIIFNVINLLNNFTFYTT